MGNTHLVQASLQELQGPGFCGEGNIGFVLEHDWLKFKSQKCDFCTKLDK